MSLSPFQIVAILWGIVTAAYLILFLYRSIVGMKEEDTLYLSAGEARLEAQQREVMKHITRLDAYAHRLGYAALALTLVLAGMWVYSVARDLL